MAALNQIICVLISGLSTGIYFGQQGPFDNVWRHIWLLHMGAGVMLFTSSR